MHELRVEICCKFIDILKKVYYKSIIFSYLKNYDMEVNQEKVCPYPFA